MDYAPTTDTVHTEEQCWEHPEDPVLAQVIALIDEISEQTNLLAMNAALEASEPDRFAADPFEALLPKTE